MKQKMLPMSAIIKALALKVMKRKANKNVVEKLKKHRPNGIQIQKSG